MTDAPSFFADVVRAASLSQDPGGSSFLTQGHLPLSGTGGLSGASLSQHAGLSQAEFATDHIRSDLLSQDSTYQGDRFSSSQMH